MNPPEPFFVGGVVARHEGPLKDNTHSIGDGMQQGLDYAATLDIPFVFSSNGDGFVFHDRTGQSATIETNLGLDAFPSPADLWARYRAWKGLDAQAEEIDALDGPLLKPLGRRSLPVGVDQQHRVVPLGDGDRREVHGRRRLPDPALEIRDHDIHRDEPVCTILDNPE
jgi:hypothetical protein